MSGIGTYAFVNAKVRAMRSYLLDTAQMRQLIGCSTYRDFFNLLADFGYGDLIEEIGTHQPERLENALFGVEVARLQKIQKSSKGNLKQFISLLLERHEAERLKRILRLWFHQKNSGNTETTETKWASPVNPILYAFSVDSIMRQKTLSDILPYLAGTPFESPVAENLAEFEKRKSLFSVELAIDRLELARFYDAVRKFGSNDQKIIQRLTGVETDIRNLAWIGRFKQYYGMSSADIADRLLPGGFQLTGNKLRDVIAEKNLSGVLQSMMKGFEHMIPASMEGIAILEALEQFMGQVLLSEARRAFREMPFSIGSLMGYYYLLHLEMRNIRTIAGAKFYDLAPEEVERYLLI